MRRIAVLWMLFLIGFLSLLGLASCRKTGQEPTSAALTSTAGTEGEATRITDATPLSDHQWKQPTTVIKVEATATSPATAPAADAEMIERGKGLYESRSCAKCHGEKAEGMSGKGAKLAGTSLTEAEFLDILRTGGKGRLGNEHIFGTSVISESGVKAVYAFLRSLASGN
jgi:mono/diheme cytochrome c family protein